MIHDSDIWCVGTSRLRGWFATITGSHLSAAKRRSKHHVSPDISREVSWRLSIKKGAFWHTPRLSKITSGVLRDLYGIIPKPLEEQVKVALKYGIMLDEWKDAIGDFISTPNIELLQITYQRQYSVLNLAFAHTQILLYRPFVLRNIACLGRGLSRRHSHLQEVLEENVNNCLRAACRTLEIFHDLCKAQRMHKCFWVRTLRKVSKSLC